MPRRAEPHPTDEVARRLFFTRLALGYPEQGRFAKDAGLTAPTYNPFEKGTRPLTMYAANLLCKRYGLTLDWLYQGIPDRLPHALVVKLVSLGAPIADLPGALPPAKK